MVSLSADGLTVGIGSLQYHQTSSGSGIASLYRWTGSEWSQIADDIYGEEPLDRNGSAVALSADGHTAAIGAMWHVGSGGFDSGHVRVFQVGLDNPYSLAADTISVTVEPVNDKPVLDVVASITILEDAATQTVNLSGISAGGGETQPLRVTATSSNPGLIPNPVVTYASPDGTGSIAFAPAADQHGTATITVTVA